MRFSGSVFLVSELVSFNVLGISGGVVLIRVRVSTRNVTTQKLGLYLARVGAARVESSSLEQIESNHLDPNEAV